MTPRGDEWRISVALLVVGTLIVLSSWWSSALHLAQVWWTVDIFSHGLMVPFLAAFLIYQSSGHLRRFTPQPSAWGSALLLILCLVWATGRVGEAKVFEHFALLLMPSALIFMLFGWAVFRTLSAGLLYLILALPVGGGLIEPLQIITAKAVIFMLNIGGLLVSADGVLIELKSGFYEVAKACAGVKFVFTSSVLGAFLSVTLYQKYSARLLVVSAAFFIPIVANIVRVITILLIAENSDQTFAKSVDHIVYGWGFLSVVLMILVAVAFKFAPVRFEQNHNRRLFFSSASGWPKGKFYRRAVVITGVAFVPLSAGLTSYAQEKVQGQPYSFTQLECSECQWRKIEFNGQQLWQQQSADNHMFERFRSQGHMISVVRYSWTDQSNGRGHIFNVNRRMGPGWIWVDQLASQPNQVSAYDYRLDRYRRGDDWRYVASMFWTNDQIVTSELGNKLKKFKAHIQRQNASGVMILVALDGANDENAITIMHDFWAQFHQQLVPQDLTASGAE